MALNKKTTTPVKEEKEVVKEKTTVTNIGTALADIQKRADARKKLVAEGQKKLNDARKVSKEKTKQTGSGKLQGLASLKNTLGRQYYKPESDYS